jgi:hypothetical protein
LNHQIDVADVQAHFERCSGDHGLEFARFQAAFGVVPQVCRQ